MGRKNRSKHNPNDAKRVDKMEGRLLNSLKAEWARNHPNQHPRTVHNQSVFIPKPTNQKKWDN